MFRAAQQAKTFSTLYRVDAIEAWRGDVLHRWR